MSKLAYASEKIKAPSLVSLQTLFEGRMDQVNEKILKSLECSVPLIQDIAGYLIKQGGKRLRPLLTLASAELCGYKGHRHVGLASAVEFIHTATLLHDDVVDESALRRGAATANTIWNNTASVLVGDFLFSRAFQLMVEDGSLDVLKVLSQASATIAEGEVMQLASARNLNLREENYLAVIGAKTACLFEAATHVGALVADASSEKCEALRKFGFNLGMAFQLTDDALDYCATGESLGKHVGDDFAEGKVTLPILITYHAATEIEKAFIKKCFVDLTQEPQDLTRMIKLIHDKGALQAVSAKAQSYLNNARECLKIFEETSLKSTLLETLDFVLVRNH
ncbi:Octaprenyl-diphosphate synthase [Candidatus Bealeia paramacronuclearis]|uniref:Octaprenyl-diphosphate synthase n=1 Tax=Candidatus Bealeia paramacronuclearis TaxID=1921001 RepID=A0ABZ2C4Q6_9PROT|nr:Octaprenyl-diphosphate synthase [Candidatus Bealeia paramacronuclearis]